MPQRIKIDALIGRKKSRTTNMRGADLAKKAPFNCSFWRIYSACAYIMVSLSYTSCKEVREDQ